MAAYTVERRGLVPAPVSVVHGLVDDFHAWPRWSPWEDLDPDLERTYTGPERGVGAHYAWSGNRKAGSGSMEITGSAPEEITLDLEFLKPFRSRSRLTFSFAPSTPSAPGDDAATEVVWRMDGETTGLMRVMSRFMDFEKFVGPDFEKGLARLAVAAQQG